MGNRTTTNLLLAIIAAVLLFGSAAVTSAIKWIAIAGGVLFALYAVVSFAFYLVRQAARNLVDAKVQGRDAFLVTLVGLLFVCFLPVFGGYAILLWLHDVPKPTEAIAQTWVGKTWLGMLLAGGVVVGGSRLYTCRAEILPTLKYGLSILIRSPLAPILLTIRGWRRARSAGDNGFFSAASAITGLIFGLFVWLASFTIFALIILE
jgi:hypothetical protein